MVAYERVFKTVFDWETKRLFTKWSLTGGGRLREVVARRELTVYILTMYDESVVNLSAQYIGNVLNCYKSLKDVESFSSSNVKI